MALILVPPRGKQTQPEQYLLGYDEVSIGRVDGNSITLKDDSVSRHHARIKWDGENYVLKDLDSANGTFVRDEKITEITLKDGDEILIGKTMIIFAEPPDPEATVRLDMSRYIPDSAPKPTRKVPEPPLAKESEQETRLTAIASVKVQGASSRHYAGFWIRVAAYLLDVVFLSIICAIIIVPVAVLTVSMVKSNPALIPLLWMGAGLAGSLIPLLYLLLFWSFKSTTPGKSICGLRIIREDNVSPLGFGKAILRLIGYIISGFILYIGFIMIAFTKRKRGLHDMIAGTMVIRKEDK